jgi:hypothetical protein
VKRPLLLGALVATLVPAWMAGAAHSSRRSPAAIDFEQALPARGAQAAGAYVSPVIRAPRRFDAVGVAKSRHPLAYRVRRFGGRWTRWLEPDAGDPVWAGGADEVQIRSEHGRPAGRLHYVNVSRPPARAARAHSSQNQPPFVSRTAWGADQSCKPRAPAAYGQVQAGIVHHTVSANDYSAADAPGIVLAICRFHRNGNGWNDIGYNALVDRFGVLYEGRAGGLEQPVVGAQAQGFNSQTTGIASIGTHESVPLSEPALRAVASFFSWKFGLTGIPPTGQVTLVSQGGKLNRFPAGRRVTLERIFGHRDVDSTACPGGALYGQLAQLRSMVTVPSLPVPVISLQLRPTVVDYPEATILTGQVAASDTHQPLAGVPVQIQVLGKHGWRPYSQLVTDEVGGFSTAVAVAGSRAFRARVPAYGTYRTGVSPRQVVQVRPALTARFSYLSHFEVGARALVRGTVRPKKRALTMAVLRQAPSGSFRRLAQIPVRPVNGRFAVAYRFRRAGHYAFRLIFRGDRANAVAQTEDLMATVKRSVGLGSGGKTSGL